MNKGTKIRTILGVLTTLNTVLAVTDVTQFGNETITFWYKIVSVIVNAIVVAINTYYNNDYTEEACIGTGITRQLKAEQKDGYVGDLFYTDEDGETVSAQMDVLEDEFEEFEELDEEGELDE